MSSNDSSELENKFARQVNLNGPKRDRKILAERTNLNDLNLQNDYTDKLLETELIRKRGRSTKKKEYESNTRKHDNKCNSRNIKRNREESILKNKHSFPYYERNIGSDEEYYSRYNGLRLYATNNSRNGDEFIRNKSIVLENSSELEVSSEEIFESEEEYINRNIRKKSKFNYDNVEPEKNIFEKRKNNDKYKQNYAHKDARNLSKEDRQYIKKKRMNDDSNKEKIEKNKDRERKVFCKNENKYNIKSRIKSSSLNEDENKENILNHNNTGFFDDLNFGPSISWENDKNVQHSLHKIKNEIKDLKKDFVKETSKADSLITFNQIQKEIEDLKINQKQMIEAKEKTIKEIENELLKVKKEARKEKKIEIEILIEKQEKEMEEKNIYIKNLVNKNKQTLEKYRTACMSKIKKERCDYRKKIDDLKNNYEVKITKYKSVYLKLKEKYKNDIIKKYSDM